MDVSEFLVDTCLCGRSARSTSTNSSGLATLQPLGHPSHDPKQRPVAFKSANPRPPKPGNGLR